MKGKLYLIPTPLSDQSVEEALPKESINLISSLEYFIVENAKSARSFLKKLGTKRVLQELDIKELNEHSKAEQLPSLLEPILKGQNCGLISETGAPCVADPGANLVAFAHQNGVEAVPLVGPSSILMALMCSGLNGQNFSFGGYLPAKPDQREDAIRRIEKISKDRQQAQFFIEAPYRVDALFKSFLKCCQPDTKLSVAVNIGAKGSWNKMMTIAEWKKQEIELDGSLVIFGLEGK